jgi:uncharacterized protein YndB with AHSA1/START domain
MLAINIRAPHVLVAEIAPGMAARGYGMIVTVGSWMAQVGSSFGAMYTATKAADEQLTRSWAAEYGPRGVRVNAIAPGVTLTPGNEAHVAVLDAMTATTPAGKPVQPQDIADGVLYLASDQSSMVHGITLYVDGGISATRLNCSTDERRALHAEPWPSDGQDGTATRSLVVSSSGTIHAPTDRVFAALMDPDQLAAMSPRAVLLEVEELPSGGHRVHWSARWHGLGYRFTVVTKEYEPPSRVTFATGDLEWATAFGKLLTSKPVSKLFFTLRLCDRQEWALAASEESTLATVTLTWRKMRPWTPLLMKPLVQRHLGVQLRHIQDEITAAPSTAE